MRKVFIDANVFIQAGKPPGGPLVSRIVDLAKAGLIEVLTTDLTLTEVAKKHTDNDFNVLEIVSRPFFRKLVSEHVRCNLPKVNMDDLKASISKKYIKEVSVMFEDLNAKVLEIDEVKPSTVFAAYSERKVFFSGDGKKDQFSDAFIFECLKMEASKESPVIIISKDKDFDVPVKSVEHISLLNTVPELFQKLGLQVEAPEVERFLHENENELLELVENELGYKTLYASDGEDVYIEVDEVTRVEPVDLISFGSLEKGGDILIVGTAKITSLLKYERQNCDTETYDSELKIIIPWDEVDGYAGVTFEADFSMSIFTNANGQPTQIKEFRFRNNLFIIDR
jgi:PIN domain-containing protein